MARPRLGLSADVHADHTVEIAALLANVPALAAVLTQHLGRDPWKAASVVLRAGPTSLRELVRSSRVRGHVPGLAVVADAAAGRREEALEALRALISSGTPGQLRAAAAVAAVLDRPDLADTAVHRLPERDPARLRLSALAAWSEGSLSEAVGLAERGASGRRGRLATSLRGQLSVLEARQVKALPAQPAPSSVGSPHPLPPGTSVLHVVTNALPEVQAGYTIRTQGIAAAQRAAGLDARVVTRLGFPVDTGRVSRSANFDHDGVPTHRLLPLRGVPVRADRRLEAHVEHLTRLARRLDVDVLHAHSRHENGQAALLSGLRLDRPVIYEARGFLEETWRSRGGRADSDFYRLSRAAETACMRAAAAVVTVSEPMRADIVARGIPMDKVTVVGNAVSADYLTPPPDATALRSRLGIAPDALVVGLVSTLNDYEGVDVLLRAAALVDDPGLVVLVVGDGPARRDLERIAHDCLDPGRAVFTGRVPHAAARDHHAALDVFCVPRRRTPVTSLVPPLKPLEAMATARPVVVSDLPPLVELVGADEGLRTEGEPPSRGLVAAPDDPASWAEALKVLLYDPALRTRMGQSARRWVHENRTWGAAELTYADLYARVLNLTGTAPDRNEGATRGT
ncbi:glycosyltransferase family 4 protein [Intrasporangium calvum]|uniref:D-inositol 3-phosphate glycosyltransferase n=1 Tax=Intrasporangium calvum TaxID=53358 RepID=A0ABT5GFT7_9MICO|nr:glycosyltransferase family 4 protein [Intrasporangium calvum]MDC5696750.1 glycosyltransferase family 4 protein [Intrasporangium calvum]